MITRRNVGSPLGFVGGGESRLKILVQRSGCSFTARLIDYLRETGMPQRADACGRNPRRRCRQRARWRRHRGASPELFELGAGHSRIVADSVARKVPNGGDFLVVQKWKRPIRLLDAFVHSCLKAEGARDARLREPVRKGGSSAVCRAIADALLGAWSRVLWPFWACRVAPGRWSLLVEFADPFPSTFPSMGGTPGLRSRTGRPRFSSMGLASGTSMDLRRRVPFPRFGPSRDLERVPVAQAAPLHTGRVRLLRAAGSSRSARLLVERALAENLRDELESRWRSNAGSVAVRALGPNPRLP